MAYYDQYSSGKSQTFGDIANNVFGGVMGVKDILKSIILISGVSMIVVATAKYFQHRKNPIYIPMSTVVWMLFVGALLILLALIPFQLTS